MFEWENKITIRLCQTPSIARENPSKADITSKFLQIVEFSIEEWNSDQGNGIQFVIGHD